MPAPLTKRLEILEARTGTGAARVTLVFACPECGEPLAPDDRGSRCNTHPRLSLEGLVILVRFVAPGAPPP